MIVKRSLRTIVPALLLLMLISMILIDCALLLHLPAN